MSPTVSAASDAFFASGAFSVYGQKPASFITGNILTSVKFDIRISTLCDAFLDEF
jgi:hypothetical protein